MSVDPGEDGVDEQGPPSGRARTRFEGALVACRSLVLIPVVVLAAGALGSFAYGADLFVLAVHEVAVSALPIGNKLGRILVVIDLFLIGATLLIASFGFYELFVGRPAGEGSSRLPGWLQMRDLNDLKARVISMLVLIAAVDFVEVLVDSTGGLALLERGSAVALVIGALTAYVHVDRRGRDAD